jgi:serine/threonine-protein kinase
MISRRGPIPTQEAIPLFKQALLGIGYAHRLGIVHRDIKPANLMLNAAGIVKVMDFGIAKAVGERGMTRTGSQVGTVHYMSPEQVKSENVDTRSDIYALGITLYEMLSGRVPFLADSEFDVLTDHVKTPPPPPSNFHQSISKGIESVVLKALAKNPNDRFQTVEEFGAALEHPERWETIPVQPKNFDAKHFETTVMNYSIPHAAPPPPAPAAKGPAPAAKGKLGLIAAIIAGGVCFLGLSAFAAFRFWPHPVPVPAAAPVAAVNPAPTLTPVADTPVEATPAIPPGALETPSTPAAKLEKTIAVKAAPRRPDVVASPAKASSAILGNGTPPPPPPLAPMRAPDVIVPAGQEVVVRLANAIEASGTQTGLIYSVTVNSPIVVNGHTAIPAGSVAEIEVAKFEKPGRVKGGGKLDLALKSITIAGRKYPIASDEFELTGSPKKNGKFGVIGAVAGGVAHGVRGAAAPTSQMDLAAETLLNFHLTAPLTLAPR